MVAQIVDTFMWNGEVDILECRFHETEPYVDRWVIAEADRTFSGAPRAFAWDPSRFARWVDRVDIIQTVGLQGVQPRDREMNQRNQLVGRFAPDDVVLHGDVDEIPRERAVRAFDGTPVTLMMRHHAFAVDWLYPDPWPGTVVALGRDAGNLSALRCHREHLARVPDAGWHLTWLGMTEDRMHKLRSFSHTELVGPLEGPMARDALYRDGIHTDGLRMEPVDVDDTWPRWVAARHCPPEWFRRRD